MSYTIKNALLDFPSVNLTDGMILALKNSLPSVEKTKKNGVLQLRQRWETDTAEVALDETHRELVKTKCTCSEFCQKYFSCEHTAATLMTYLAERDGMDSIKESPIGARVIKKTKLDNPFLPGILKGSDPEMMRFLKQNFSNATKSRPVLDVTATASQPLSLQAKCCIAERQNGLLIELRVGEKRPYVVKDLYGFFYEWTHKQTITLGKNFQFTPDETLFDENGRKIIRFFLEEYFYNEASGSKNIYQYGYFNQQKRSFSLFGTRVDQFMETIAKDGVGLVSNEKQTIVYTGKSYQPNIQVEKQTYGANIRVEQYRTFCESLDYQYVLKDNELYRMDKMDENTRKLIELCQTKKELYVSDQDLPIVARDMLSNLQEKTAISYIGMDPSQYLPQKPTLELYLDYPQTNMITCDAAAVYGEKKYHIFGKEKYNQKRNFTEERQLAELIQPYFNAYDQEKSLLVYSGDEGDIYTFLSQILPKLKKLAELYVSRAMDKLRVIHSSGFQVGVAVSGGLLEMSMVSNQFNNEELAEIFSSYDPKKHYHRLKDGRFITFTGEQEQVLSVFSDAMNYAEKKNPESIRMPLFRALYLDEMLKDKESVELKKNREYRRLIGRMRSYENGNYEVPESLESTLREYQRDGFYWIKTLKENGFGGILADDMGLGKTLQVLTFLLSEKEEGKSGDALRTLIVAPASLVYNWKKEIEKFTPDLCVCVIAGTAKEREALIKEKAGGADVWITSYDLLKRDIDAYGEITFANEIIDEAQYIKNQTTHASKSVRLVNSSFRMALTGTPMENRLSELWSIFDYLMPGFLYGYMRFRNELETPIVSDQDEDAMTRLRAMIHPFILRRLKKDVLKELPEKQEEIVTIELAGEQKKLYQAHAQRLKMSLEKQNDDEFAQNKLQILAELTKLRQLCCGPELILENYKGENAKLETCIQLITQAIEGGHKILLFSQFTSMLDRIGEALSKEKIDYYRIDGSVKKETRMELVDQFQDPKNPVAVFCISLKAGGTGLNLTAADIVIHYDPWWNKAAQNQATDRAHRIGQKHSINVYQLIAENTIEQKICELQQAKYDLAEEVLSGESISSIQFNKEEIMNLLEK